MTHLNEDLNEICRNWCPRINYCPSGEYCTEMKTIRTMIMRITNDINEED